VIDPSTQKSKGYGFISFDSFESADKAKLNLNGQFLCDQPMTGTYTFMAESKK
jgi:splicing factor 3B subunit 4